MCVVVLLGYIFVYQIGLGPIPFFCGSGEFNNSQYFFFKLLMIQFAELFEVGPRPVAMSMGSLSSWFCNFVIGMTFPTLQRALGASVFLIFSSVCILLALFLKFYMPETRGKDTFEISQKVADGFRSRPLETKVLNVNSFN